MDLDPEKSVARQLDKGKDDGPPLKDDPTYCKYFTMLKMNLPMMLPFTLYILMHFAEYLHFIFG
ncbi:LOW QUALITY PROTEIN: hypothetical protein ACHAW5_007624 [Stephanodiscus triporus]|uniref:Uncharacterized protein n=1 Tax=Stephanodiscus triporus TaxID=2934178 RepID=A0ABD3N5F9_9STRA